MNRLQHKPHTRAHHTPTHTHTHTSIFMASMMASGVSLVTIWPGTTSTLSMRPVMGAITAEASLCLAPPSATYEGGGVSRM